MPYVPLRKAVNALGLHPNTLRKYADSGAIPSIKNEAGQRLYDIETYINGPGDEVEIIYARVSSYGQRDDLRGQINYLQKQYPYAEVIKDIGGGLNFKRKGLRAILERAMSGDKLKIIVAHKDRLARFGFELIQYIIESNGGTVLVLNEVVHSPEQELVNDILTIIHTFSCRLYGLRKYRDKIKADKTLSDPKPKTKD